MVGDGEEDKEGGGRSVESSRGESDAPCVPCLKVDRVYADVMDNLLQFSYTFLSFLLKSKEYLFLSYD